MGRYPLGIKHGWLENPPLTADPLKAPFLGDSPASHVSSTCFRVQNGKNPIVPYHSEAALPLGREHLSKSAASWVEATSQDQKWQHGKCGRSSCQKTISPQKAVLKKSLQRFIRHHHTSSHIVTPVLVHFLQIGGLHVLFQRLILVEALPQFLVLDVPRIEVLSSAGSLENVDPWKARGW